MISSGRPTENSVPPAMPISTIGPVKLPNGKWVQRSTEAEDPIAARAKAGLLQARALEGHEAENQGAYRLESCLLTFLETRKATGRSKATINMYKTKAGHLIRLLGRDTDVNYPAAGGLYDT